MGSPIISDTDAARIASEWHSSDGTGIRLLQLSSSGAIVAGVVAEIDGNLAYLADPDTKSDEYWTPEAMRQDAAELHALRAYVLYHGERDEQPGWGTLRW